MSFFNKTKNSRRYVLGYDLGEEVSQISFLASDSDLPETLSTLAGAEAYNIPTVLCKRNEVNQWFYGKEALSKVGAGEGVKVDGLIEKARLGKRVDVDGTGYDPVSLLTLFVKRTLSLLSMEMSMDMVDAIAFTTKTMDSRMIEVLSEVTGALSLHVKNIFYQSYEDSLYHYMLYQPDELLTHAVIACDYSFGEMTVYDMKLNHRTKPIVVTIDKSVYDGMALSEGRLSDNTSERAEQVTRLDTRFLEFAKNTMDGRIVSSVFLLGDGFRDQWMSKSLEFLCRTRRVFQGNNLFSKGASIAAREKVGASERSEKYVLLDGGKLKSNLGIMVKKQGQEVYHALLDAGENWFDVGTQLDMILDDENSVNIVITPLTAGDRYTHTIELTDLPQRPPRATRIRMKISMSSANKVNVHIEDMGFGELFEASDMYYDEEISV
ncbi:MULTISPECIES: DUF5716 family protein [unclassified Butyrivibrio]|uniref:DUF5716 family protein n=1 Tax=unclassified Butyrivibrio TaxID=2639466 RepID=UPI0004067C16|nr:MULTISPECIES: DUF5716 family protein [unclassified Butyrivibrio]